MPKLASLKDLMIEELKDLYDAEHQLVQALPKMAKAASNSELKTAFTAHLDETRGHITRLEQVFELLGKKPTRKTCKAMKGLVEEGSEMMGQDAEASVMDAALISSAQRVEHYEIAAYGALRTYAQTLELEDVFTLLQEILDEEWAADKKLSQIAEMRVNQKAMQEA